MVFRKCPSLGNARQTQTPAAPESMGTDSGCGRGALRTVLQK